MPTEMHVIMCVDDISESWQLRFMWSQNSKFRFELETVKKHVDKEKRVKSIVISREKHIYDFAFSEKLNDWILSWALWMQDPNSRMGIRWYNWGKCYFYSSKNENANLLICRQERWINISIFWLILWIQRIVVQICIEIILVTEKNNPFIGLYISLSLIIVWQLNIHKIFIKRCFDSLILLSTHEVIISCFVLLPFPKDLRFRKKCFKKINLLYFQCIY